MSLINKEVSDFRVQAYQSEEFREVAREDILGRWSIFFFYPADFTFVCPTELEDLAEKYDDFEAYLSTLEEKYGFRLKDCQWMVTETYQERSFGF